MSSTPLKHSFIYSYSNFTNTYVKDNIHFTKELYLSKIIIKNNKDIKKLTKYFFYKLVRKIVDKFF